MILWKKNAFFWRLAYIILVMSKQENEGQLRFRREKKNYGEGGKPIIALVSWLKTRVTLQSEATHNDSEIQF